MKFFASLLLFISFSVFAQTTSTPKFKFTEDTHDFGIVKEGDMATFEYVFTNVGSEPLIINNCTAQCGCTVPTWSRNPILPGSKGTISVTFNSQGKTGPQQKTVYIESNAPTGDPMKQKFEIYFKCSVVPKQ